MGVALTAMTLSCGDEGNGGTDPEEPMAPECLPAPADAQCTVRAYPPADGVTYKFSNIFGRSIDGTCNVGPCHDAVDPAGGLDMTNERRAYEGLLDMTVDPPRVTPGDVQCGKLIVYLETPGEWYSMPSGGHLEDAQLCVFRQWIAAGANQ